ncbi:MAG: hypothetical protein DRI44_00035 [Chlamydiae bacterium]|nr:MAG: hypothetical protein DRI44_00035 [Chlamydiota bacterium]
MDKKSLIDILKVVLVLGFVLLPPIIKAFAKSKKAEGITPPRRPDTQRNKLKAAKRVNRKPIVNYQEKPKLQKKVEDVLAEIFGDKLSPLTPERERLPSKTHKQEIHKTARHSIEPKNEELPRFKTNIKNFKVSDPSLPDDIKGFNPNIHTAAEISEQTSPFLKKFQKMSRDDLRYGVIISEILGPPVSLK